MQNKDPLDMEPVQFNPETIEFYPEPIEFDPLALELITTSRAR